MIKSVKISNFKSVVDLSLDLGSFNVLIGENGCGKSNILEALAFGAAANADKLDNEFLGSRGIRMTKPDFMYSAFSSSDHKKDIHISINDEKSNNEFQLVTDEKNPKKWIDINRVHASLEFENFLKALMINDDDTKKQILAQLNNEPNELANLPQLLMPFSADNNFKEFFFKAFPKLMNELVANTDISSYIVYSPEQSSLRKFEETTQIYPLGIKGEGLFQYLKELAFDKESRKVLKEIKENLALLDWYEDFQLPKNLMSNEFSLNIKDRYLDSNLQYFDQRSTNEGFLYLLFYSTLFISRTTPAFFAIDNIDASFNPKLCMELTRNLASLTQKHEKQVIVTTHNPAILDGLNLQDDNQRLFVVRRNDEGHTIARRIEYKSGRTMKLSEVWTNGFIGGLPENF
jgi:predicted ATPase